MSKRKRLLVAITENVVVRVDRKPTYAEPLYGFVVRIGAKWALMAQVSEGGYADGFVAFRVGDVARVESDGTIATTFAKSQPDWPRQYEHDLDLDRTRGVLADFGSTGGLMGIEKESERRALWVGIFDEILDRHVYLHEVRPDGTWHDEPLGYELNAVSAIHVETRYLEALSAVAGSAPRGGAEAP